MKLAEQLEARLRAVLFEGATTRRLLQLRQRRPDLARELDRIAECLAEAGDELLRWIRTLEAPDGAEPDGAEPDGETGAA